MKKTRIAINGAGRIGRAFLKAAMNREELEVVAMNDLGSIDNIAYLIKYDTVYGKAPFSIDVNDDKKKLRIDGKEIAFLSEPDPTKLPWKDLDVDIVIESTGVFTTYEKAEAHRTAGAKRVIISAPVKDEPRSDEEATILVGVNDDKLKTCTITSNASCTTNAGSPLMQILHEAIGIEKALLSTVHAYTATQAIVDGPAKKDNRKGRAAAQNIIPTSTGAAIATTKAIPDLEGLFDGIALRVPVPAGSIVDITFLAKRDTTVEEVNQILKDAAGTERWNKVFAVTEEDLVSSDIIGSHFASIADLQMTRIVGGNLVKVLAWYDNEMGYTHALLEHAVRLGSHI